MEELNKDNRRLFVAYGLAFVSVALAAMGTTSVQLLGGSMPDMELNIWRFLAQFLFITIGAAVTRQDLRVRRQHWLQLSLITVIFWAGNMCYFSMPKYLPVGTMIGLYTGFCICASGVLACAKKTITATIASSVVLTLLGSLFLTQPLVIFENSGLFRHAIPNWTSSCWDEVLPWGDDFTQDAFSLLPMNSTGDFNDRTSRPTKLIIDAREYLLESDSLAKTVLDKGASRIWIDSSSNSTLASLPERIYGMEGPPNTYVPFAVIDIDSSGRNSSTRESAGNATYADFWRIPLFLSETWKGYLFLLGAVGTVTVGMQLTRSLQEHVAPVVVIFWAALFSTILAGATSGMSERLVLFRGRYCVQLVMLHAICSGIYSSAVLWLMKYMQPVTCALTWNLELVFLMTFQYTFMSSVNPGLGNWLEVVGAVLCFLAGTVGPLSELLAEWRERNKKGYEDLDKEKLEEETVHEK